MGHYIDADKLKEYLADRYEVCPISDDERHGRHCAIIEIQNFIASSQQEQPEVNWGKEIYDTCRRYWIRGNFDVAELDKHDIENIARHFYELGLNARKEDSK